MESEPQKYPKERDEKRSKNYGLLFILLSVGACLAYFIYDMRRADEVIQKAAKEHQ